MIQEKVWKMPVVVGYKNEDELVHLIAKELIRELPKLQIGYYFVVTISEIDDVCHVEIEQKLSWLSVFCILTILLPRYVYWIKCDNPKLRKLSVLTLMSKHDVWARSLK